MYDVIYDKTTNLLAFVQQKQNILGNDQLQFSINGIECAPIFDHFLMVVMKDWIDSLQLSN